jgi:poly(3-hydroxybutyrate) depolymerase
LRLDHGERQRARQTGEDARSSESVHSGTNEAAEPDAKAGASALGCVTDVSAGDHTFACDGFEYDVRVPAACAAGGCGVVLDTHGATMDAAMEDANTNMRAIGEREGYVVVQPNANPKPPTSGWNAADYDHVWAFLSAARQAYAIDPKRVHVTGFSQGGEMTWAFTCAHADEIASAAPAALSGCTAENLGTVKRQVPVLYMHGKNDGIAAFDKFAASQRDAVISAWQMGAPTVVGQDASYTWSRYTNDSGGLFEFIEHTYTASSGILKGHCFPGSKDPGGLKGQLFSFACTSPNAFVWGEEVIEFFKAHPMP